MPSECDNCAPVQRLLGTRDVRIRELEAQVAPARSALAELELAHAELDNSGVPRQAPSGNEFTLTGRIKWMRERSKR